MTKKDLMNGDIVVMANGSLAVVIKKENEPENSYLLYSDKGGYDFLDDYNDDMTYMYPENDDELDCIMQVYRATGAGISFMDFEDEYPIYERDYTWVRPKKETVKKPIETVAEKEKGENLVKNNDLISVLIQAFYGNRVRTFLTNDEIDDMLRSVKPYNQVNRTFIKLPDTECYLVYNKYREEYTLKQNEKWLKEEGYVAKPLGFVPELGIEIYSRCIVCRRDEQGELKSLEKDDYAEVIKYLAE